MLRERDATGSASWSDIVAHCLRASVRVPDEASRGLLVTAAGNLESLENLIATLDAAAVSAGSDDTPGPRRSSGCSTGSRRR